MKHRNELSCIGVDQSYQRTGISIAVDNRLVAVSSIDLLKFKTKSEKRTALHDKIVTALHVTTSKTERTVCVLERVRTFSDGALSVPYIKSMGALNAVVVDACYEAGVEVYSIDTRCWKSHIIGTSKPLENKYGILPKKWPTIQWFMREHKNFEKCVLVQASKAKKKGIIIKDGVRYTINDDACDSAAIALSYFTIAKEMFKPEN